jgi:hypothetical protein
VAVYLKLLHPRHEIARLDGWFVPPATRGRMVDLLEQRRLLASHRRRVANGRGGWPYRFCGDIN